MNTKLNRLWIRVCKNSNEIISKEISQSDVDRINRKCKNTYATTLNEYYHQKQQAKEARV